MKNTVLNLGKVLGVFFCLCVGILITGTVGVKADENEQLNAVCVTTLKELNEAINNPDIDYIHFRTYKFADITIKANENAKNKTLLIDAQHVNITNKAVFRNICIDSICDYVEKASGNIITLFGLKPYRSFTIAKNKTVDKLEFVSDYAFEDTFSRYVLRKGAKIKEVMLYYESTDGEVFAQSTYDEDKKEINLEYTDYEGNTRSYTVSLDKDGRISTMVSNDTFKCDYTFSYDGNGNMTGVAGFDEDEGNFKGVYTFENNHLLKFTIDGEKRKYEENFTIDENGRTVATKISDVKADGESTTFYSYNYDSKGRPVYEYVDYGKDFGKLAYYHTYNSKNFLTKTVLTYYTPDGQQDGDSEITTDKFNKKGFLIKKTITCGDSKITTKYEYDELGFTTDVKTVTDEGTGRVELPMTSEEFIEFNHLLFAENQQEKMFERHTSLSVSFYNDFAPAKDDAYGYYVTPDSVYYEAANWMSYEKDRLIYMMSNINDTKESRMDYIVSLVKDWNSTMWRAIPTEEDQWIDYERDSFIGAYKEDGKIHLFSVYDEELSKEFAENTIGVEYEGESYITETVFDEKTYDYLEFIITKELNGVSEIVGRTVYEYDLPEPVACTALRCAFESKTENMVNATFVLEPGTKNEIKKMFKVPVDTYIAYFIEDPEIYEVFSDSKCEKPVTEKWDKMSDLSVYFKRIDADK